MHMIFTTEGYSEQAIESFIIVSDYHKRHEEILKLKSVPRQNRYPTRFLDKIISKFLDKSFKNRVTITFTTVPKKTLRLVLPYLLDAIPRSLLSGVIYEYKCPRWNSRYIGSAYRYWEKRCNCRRAIAYVSFNG